MKAIRAFLLRLRGVVSQRDLGEEIEANLQLHIDDNIGLGMTPRQARREAIMKLGGLETSKEAYRDRATLPLLENVLRDMRFALRQLRKYPGFTCTAILMLALGMCASVAIFAFVDAALLKPLPYKDPHRLVGVYEKINGACPLCNLSYPDFLDWKRSNTVFTAFDAYNQQGQILTAATGPERAYATRVTDGFFRTLGVSPILGRDFRHGEDLLSAPRTAILSYSAWQRRYGGKPDVLGQTVILNGAASLIIGVLPPQFHFAPSEPTDFWVTMHASSECDLRRSCHGLYGVARLKDGVSFQTALADVTRIADELQKRYPGSNNEQGAALEWLSKVINGDIRPILLVMLAGACLLLLIAAVNVASLLLVRTESRRRELAVRSGLGASPGRIIGQFVAEGSVLVATGSALGLIGAYGVMHILLKLISPDNLLQMPFLNSIGLNVRVLGFAGLIAFLAAVLFSFTPALRLSLSEMRQGLAEGSRGSAGNTWRRLGSKLVIVELAMAAVLLAGAGLLGQSLYRLLTVRMGIQPDHVIMMSLAAPDSRYANDQQNTALQRRVTAQITSIPGVKSVGITTTAPLGFNGNTTWFKVLGRPWHGEHNDTPERDITPGYFSTIGARLLRGRNFNEAEGPAAPLVAIVNQALVRQFFPGQQPLGQHLSPLSDPPKPIEIVGVVEDIKEGQLDTVTRPVLYFPFNQSTSSYFEVFVRTTQTETAIVPAMASAIHQIDSGIMISPGKTMNELIDNSQAAYFHRSLAWLVGGFAGLALILGVGGLYGVIAYSVSQRTREIGVRMALGAAHSRVYLLVLKEAGGLALAGIITGIVCAIAAANLMRSLLFGVAYWDIPTLAVVAVVLALCALLGSFVPARRAASVNPVEALRAE